MRLHNMLTLPGGIPEQGREITIKIRYLGQGNVPYVRDIVGQLYPLSPVDALACERRAQVKAAEEKAPLTVADEYVIQVLAASLRDPSDLAQLLVEDERDKNVLRAGLVAPQYDEIMSAYKALIAQEYPGLVTEEDEKDMGEEARGFSASDQPARG